MLNTANGDDPAAYVRMYARLTQHGARPSHLQLFPMPNVSDPEDLLLSQDVIFVGGGSVANMVAVWRVHGLDDILRRAWAAGIVLAGVSAGAICWFGGGTTDSFGPLLRPFTGGLALPGRAATAPTTAPSRPGGPRIRRSSPTAPCPAASPATTALGLTSPTMTWTGSSPNGPAPPATGSSPTAPAGSPRLPLPARLLT